jgi:hypothetical protein
VYLRRIVLVLDFDMNQYPGITTRSERDLDQLVGVRYDCLTGSTDED